VGNSEATNTEVAHNTSTLTKGHEDATVTELVTDDFVSFEYNFNPCAIVQTIGEEPRSTDTDRVADLDTRRCSSISDGECEDAKELVNDPSAFESYAFAEGSDMELETEMHGEKLRDNANGWAAEMESLYEPCPDQDKYIDVGNAKDGIGVCFFWFNRTHVSKLDLGVEFYPVTPFRWYERSVGRKIQSFCLCGGIERGAASSCL
jgi:hypothetical protein